MIAFTLNGARVETDAAPFAPLSDTLRERLGQTGTKVGCCEEAAWRNGWISSAELAALAEPLLKSGYGEYLMALSKR
jgi:dTDP-glucose pyrophosphorylase